MLLFLFLAHERRCEQGIGARCGGWLVRVSVVCSLVGV